MPLVKDILANPEAYDATLVQVAEWVAGEGRQTIEDAYAEERQRVADAERETPSR